jgi:hypothetical protein
MLSVRGAFASIGDDTGGVIQRRQAIPIRRSPTRDGRLDVPLCLAFSEKPNRCCGSSLGEACPPTPNAAQLGTKEGINGTCCISRLDEAGAYPLQCIPGSAASALVPLLATIDRLVPGGLR